MIPGCRRVTSGGVRVVSTGGEGRGCHASRPRTDDAICTARDLAASSRRSTTGFPRIMLAVLILLSDIDREIVMANNSETVR